MRCSPLLPSDFFFIWVPKATERGLQWLLHLLSRTRLRGTPSVSAVGGLAQSRPETWAGEKATVALPPYCFFPLENKTQPVGLFLAVLAG